jgi:putative toxin-antitoxin system antitoxin component (TIGR02293 family)
MGLTLRETAALSKPMSLEDLLAEATRVFGDELAAREWLSEPIPSLGGRKPQEMVGGPAADRQRVLTILGRIEHGIF